MEPTIEKLKYLLKQHDVYYVYSDSLQEYRKGKEELAEIKRVVEELGESGELIYKDFINEKFTKLGL
mgnify:FL=1|jgi:hypothetical protein